MTHSWEVRFTSERERYGSHVECVWTVDRFVLAPSPAMPKSGYVYILASERNGTLYVGVTNDLVRRAQEHWQEVDPDSFTARYDVKRLVYYEHHDNIRDAIKREKRIKGWKRQWKLELIEGMNLHWRDLYSDIAPSEDDKHRSGKDR